MKDLAATSTNKHLLMSVVGLHLTALTLPRRLMMANGLAILAVVMNHAASWGFTAMFWWTDSYLDVNLLPYLNGVGSLTYYALTAAVILTRFSVPTFVFVSGYFMAYAIGGNSTLRRKWRIIASRLRWLLIPYLIWSAVIFVARWLETCEETCQTETLLTYANKLILGSAIPAYYYVIVLVVLLLSAPLLVRFVKTHWQLTLAATMLLLLTARVQDYVSFIDIQFGSPIGLLRSLFVLSFYFVLGLVCKTHMAEFRQSLERAKPFFPLAIAVFGLLAFVDIEWQSRLGSLLPDHGHTSLFLDGYATTLILAFLTFERLPIPGAGLFVYLGGNVYGIYLMHQLLLEYLARGIHKLFPPLLDYPLLFFLLLIIAAIGVPLLSMIVVRTSPFGRAYRHLFG